MAEELDDGEFWLPSQFLTDDDILNDFSNSDAFGSGSGSSSDLGSTESSDDDDQILLSGLPRQFSQSSLDCPVHSKGWVLSSSPQSTLCGCDCNHRSSSIGTPSGPVSPPKTAVSATEKDDTTSFKGDDDDDENKTAKNSTLDLLNKAAGEVARMKMRSEGVGRSTVGTGFFDCSNSAKGLLCPPTQTPLPQPQTNLTHFNPFYSHPHFHHCSPQMIWRPHHFPIPPPPQQQNRVTKTTAGNTKSSTNSTTITTTAPVRPLGLPPSAWPPLPGQTQAQAQTQSPPPQQPPQQPLPVMGMYVGQAGQKGTGVFLPRRVTPTEPKKKTDGNATKTKTNKGSQRRNNRTPKAIDDEIQLPPEWVY